MNVERYHTSTELKQLFRKEKDVRLATRIRAVHLGLMGKSAPAIATLLGCRRPDHSEQGLCLQQAGT